MTKNTRRILVLALLLGPMVAGMPRAATTTEREWRFEVSLDDQPIGEHRFASSGPAERRQVRSEASFVVRFLGIAAYRYRHEAIEHWRGDCLASLVATTDEDGKRSSVRAEADAPTVVDGEPTQALPGCAMSFAYWNPALLKQTRLLNAQTGRVEAVQVSQLGSAVIEVRGRSLTATHWRITGTAQPIDLWYTAQGDWVGLDSTVAGGRKLSYRLK